MGVIHYYLKLIPPRATFVNDITETEAALMEQHADYTRAHQAAGTVLIAGPVFAPDGAFGIAVLAVPDEAAAHAFGDNDPTVIAGLNTYELHRMRVLETAPAERG